jgi:hypothetical protein
MEGGSAIPAPREPMMAQSDLDNLLVGSSVFEDPVELDAELELLLSRYAPSREPDALREMAAVLETYADTFRVGGDRLRLWAALLRRRASGARPTTAEAQPGPQLVFINTEP